MSQRADVLARPRSERVTTMLMSACVVVVVFPDELAAVAGRLEAAAARAAAARAAEDRLRTGRSNGIGSISVASA